MWGKRRVWSTRLVLSKEHFAEYHHRFPLYHTTERKSRVGKDVPWTPRRGPSQGRDAEKLYAERRTGMLVAMRLHGIDLGAGGGRSERTWCWGSSNPMNYVYEFRGEVCRVGKRAKKPRSSDYGGHCLMY